MTQSVAPPDITNRIIIACAFILVGLVLLADMFHILPATHGAGTGQWIALGIGILLLVGEAWRATFATGGKLSTGRIILGTGAAGYGAGMIFGISTSILLPAGLIVIGIILLLRNLFSQQTFLK